LDAPRRSRDDSVEADLPVVMLFFAASDEVRAVTGLEVSLGPLGSKPERAGGLIVYRVTARRAT
jgi:hypothetical protein